MKYISPTNFHAKVVNRDRSVSAQALCWKYLLPTNRLNFSSVSENQTKIVIFYDC